MCLTVYQYLQTSTINLIATLSRVIFFLQKIEYANLGKIHMTQQLNILNDTFMSQNPSQVQGRPADSGNKAQKAAGRLQIPQCNQKARLHGCRFHNAAKSQKICVLVLVEHPKCSQLTEKPRGGSSSSQWLISMQTHLHCILQPKERITTNGIQKQT